MRPNDTKNDPALGKQVREYLISLGVETPFVTKGFTEQEDKKDILKSHVQGIMETLGLDLEDDSLRDTPRRVADMYVDELFWGLDYELFPKMTTTDNKMRYDSYILERDIKVSSTCEHHFVPIIGQAYIAYIPKDRVLGLSKLNRVVEFFSRRPQVQERLSEQIYHALSFILGTEDIAVVIRAKHLCVTMRGVEDRNSDTVTSKIGGAFFSSELRNEFYQTIKV